MNVSIYYSADKSVSVLFGDRIFNSCLINQLTPVSFIGPPSSACWLDDLEGYPLSDGWDPVTGFGTPDYHRLVAAAMKY